MLDAGQIPEPRDRRGILWRIALFLHVQGRWNRVASMERGNEILREAIDVEAARQKNPPITRLPFYEKQSVWRSGYLVMLRRAPSVFWESVKTTEGVVAVILAGVFFLAFLFNKEISEALFNWDDTGLSRGWSVLPAALYFVHLVVTGVHHDHLEDLREEIHNQKKQLGDRELRLRIRSQIANGKNLAEEIRRLPAECDDDSYRSAQDTVFAWISTVDAHLFLTDELRRHFVRRDVLPPATDNRVEKMLQFTERRVSILEEVLEELRGEAKP